MGKKRRRSRDMAMPSSPSPHDMMKWSAESMARSVAENHPKVKKLRDEITAEVMKAGERALKKGLKQG